MFVKMFSDSLWKRISVKIPSPPDCAFVSRAFVWDKRKSFVAFDKFSEGICHCLASLNS